MEQHMIAVCGIDCAVCPAHLAWKNNDDALRDRTAVEWSKAFGFAFTREHVNCIGCLAAGDGPRIGHCADCEFRRCAAGRGIGTCAECVDYACDKLQKFFAQVPAAKANLDLLGS